MSPPPVHSVTSASSLYDTAVPAPSSPVTATLTGVVAEHAQVQVQVQAIYIFIEVVRGETGKGGSQVGGDTHGAGSSEIASCYCYNGCTHMCVIMDVHAYLCNIMAQFVNREEQNKIQLRTINKTIHKCAVSVRPLEHGIVAKTCAEDQVGRRAPGHCS